MSDLAQIFEQHLKDCKTFFFQSFLKYICNYEFNQVKSTNIGCQVGGMVLIFFSIIIFNLLSSNFLKNFDVSVSKEIGLQDKRSFGGFLGFEIKTVSATFCNLVTYFNLKAALIRLVRFIMVFLGDCFNTFGTFISGNCFL